MTGFARGHGMSGPYAWTWEIKSVNGKGFDLRLRPPAGWDAVELPVRTRAAQTLTRGSLQAALVERAERAPGRRPEAIRARLAEQVATLLAQSERFDADRLYQEAIMIATRADVREELDRLVAHVAQARRLISDGGPIGRRLDFLAQEFNREANTLCAKAIDVELTNIGLELKAAVEQFREQVQNVE